MLSKMRLELRNKTMARARGKDDFDSFISEAPIALAEGTMLRPGSPNSDRGLIVR
ncbi:hypothetical protein B0J13DRAFT_570302 [Dactylonectria estremocensis]|uniref:Uncharacterized protein n=1 Tax=Dactylonectria estremocensis TaxID=1079267 RepID=A0A9P9DFN5_9HYPO|nr:hypothetical protein B0J13DRAFT_570302 [Dactylonectria estremocensis]